MTDYRVNIQLDESLATLAEHEAQLLRISLDEYFSRMVSAAFRSGNRRWKGPTPKPQAYYNFENTNR